MSNTDDYQQEFLTDPPQTAPIGQPPPGQGQQPNVPPALGGNTFTLASLTPPPQPGDADREKQRWEQRTKPPEERLKKMGDTPEFIRKMEEDDRRIKQGHFPPPWPPKFVPSRRQFYIPAHADRGPGHWGTPRHFPMAPPIWQVPDIFMGIGQQLSQILPPGLAMWALGLNRYTKAFMDGLHKGQAQYAKDHKQRSKEHARRLDHSTQEMLDRYRNAFAESSGPEDQQQLEQNIRSIASQYDDQRMLAALDNQGINGVIQILNQVDAKHSDLRATRRSQDDHESRLEGMNPFLTNPVDAEGMPAERKQLGYSTTPQMLDRIQLAGPMPVPDTDATSEAIQPDPDELRQNNPAAPTEEQPEGNAPKAEPDRPQRPVQSMPWPDQPPAAREDEDERQADQPDMSGQAKPIEPDVRGPELENRKFGPSEAAARPVRLAQADTGVTSDAPPPEATARPEKTPKQIADEGKARVDQRNKEEEERIKKEEEQWQIPDTPATRDIRTKLKNDPAGTSMVEGLAKRMLFGQLAASEIKDLEKRGIMDLVRERNDELERQIEDIERRAHTGELPRDKVLEEIYKKIGPRMAGEVTAIQSGLGSSRANIRMAPFDKVIPLAQAIDPNLNDAKLRARSRLMGDFLAGTGQRALIQGSHAFQVGGSTMEILKNQPSYARLKEWSLAHAVNARAAAALFPDVSDFMGRLQAGADNFVAETQKLFAMSHPTAGERALMSEKIDWNDPVHAIAFIKQNMQYLQWRMGDYKRMWDAGMDGVPNKDQLFDTMIGQDPGVKEIWPTVEPTDKPIEQLEGGFGDTRPGGSKDLGGGWSVEEVH